EDGIRDRNVTGVQTCALPILLCGGAVAFMYYPDLLDKLTAKPLVEEVADSDVKESVTEKVDVPAGQDNIALTDSIVSKDVVVPRSEERRVGKACRCRWVEYRR